MLLTRGRKLTCGQPHKVLRTPHGRRLLYTQLRRVDLLYGMRLRVYCTPSAFSHTLAPCVRPMEFQEIWTNSSMHKCLTSQYLRTDTCEHVSPLASCRTVPNYLQATQQRNTRNKLNLISSTSQSKPLKGARAAMRNTCITMTSILIVHLDSSRC